MLEQISVDGGVKSVYGSIEFYRGMGVGGGWRGGGNPGGFVADESSFLPRTPTTMEASDRCGGSRRLVMRRTESAP
ncbi:hypothetical protein CEXT_518541 [Caerostris extrusa]|uniref:Uncharacterized protein n=1 Tax=Caerostris extrusa TaxID=172846 RepID=A0AAV4TXD9_CAEEX|nr:hypothetical protein CEXT_518541 [Caerostris extrusa]